MSYLTEHFPNYDCNEQGQVFKNGHLAKVFKSNKYLQVLLFDKDGKRKVCGVHTVIAMKYLDYFDGCNVHHKDENTHNNKLDNLEVLSRTEHSRLHGLGREDFKCMNKGKTAWNKGIKMSKEFCEHCSVSAKRRGFNGNQFITKDKQSRIKS